MIIAGAIPITHKNFREVNQIIQELKKEFNNKVTIRKEYNQIVYEHRHRKYNNNILYT